MVNWQKLMLFCGLVEKFSNSWINLLINLQSLINCWGGNKTAIKIFAFDKDLLIQI